MTEGRLMLQHLDPRLVFSKLIIIEPMVTAAGPRALEQLRDHLVFRARKRQRLWESREALRKAYTNPARRGSKWESRVVNLFLVFQPFNILSYWSYITHAHSLGTRPLLER